MTHAIYFDRTEGQLHGVLTLQYVNPFGEAVKVFERLPVASGQYGFLNGGLQDWVVGRGATPFGRHWMSTKKEPLTSAEPYGTPFYIISTDKGSRIIKGPNGATREHIGLHLENRIPGTRGCPALLNDTPVRKCTALALFAYLDALHEFEPYIRFVVL